MSYALPHKTHRSVYEMTGEKITTPIIQCGKVNLTTGTSNIALEKNK